MSLIQVIAHDGSDIALLDISETNCPDDKLESVIENAMSMEDWDEYLEEEFGIRRVYIERMIII